MNVEHDPTRQRESDPTALLVEFDAEAKELLGSADAIVVDLRLVSENATDGTPAGELLALYTSSGKPVVAFGPDTEIAKVFTPEVVIGSWLPEPYSLVKSVQDALDSSAA